MEQNFMPTSSGIIRKTGKATYLISSLQVEPLLIQKQIGEDENGEPVWSSQPCPALLSLGREITGFIARYADENITDWRTE